MANTNRDALLCQKQKGDFKVSGKYPIIEEDDKARNRIGTLLYNLEMTEQERDAWKVKVTSK